MEITTRSIIEMLPFEEEDKQWMLSRLDHLTPDQDDTVTQLIWSIYAAIYEVRVLELMKIAKLNAEYRGTSLPEDIQSQVYKEVKEDLQKYPGLSSRRILQEMQPLLRKLMANRQQIEEFKSNLR